MPAVEFFPVNESHRDLLRHWLSQPHARAWWGETEEELALIFDDKGEHEPFIACIDGNPAAYIQAWWPSKHPDLPWQHGMTRTTRGIDIMIGDAVNLGKGYGPLIIRQFVAKLISEGATRLVIDPDSANTRAVRSYSKAGFTPYDDYREADGGITLLMELLPESFDHRAGSAQIQGLS
jgi:aminoglycoside 6'-N-acetyltransferase